MTNQRINEIAEKWALKVKIEGFIDDDVKIIKSAIFEATKELRKKNDEAQCLLDQHAYEFKQLRDELHCPGSDLPQLLAAIEELRKDREMLLEPQQATPVIQSKSGSPAPEVTNGSTDEQIKIAEEFGWHRGMTEAAEIACDRQKYFTKDASVQCLVIHDAILRARDKKATP